MSHILFENVCGRRVELRGSERHYMGQLVDNLFMAAIGPIDDSARRPSWIRRILPRSFAKDHPPGDDSFAMWAETWFRVENMKEIPTRDGLIPLWEIKLNTALLMAGPEVRLLVRLHGQCELHGWFNEYDARFFANIIKQGIRKRIYRPEQGWEDVLTLFERSAWSIVTSYSSCNYFPEVPENGDPGPGVAPCESADVDPKRYLEWWGKRLDWWSAGLKALDPKLEIKAKDWEAWVPFHFGTGTSAFDLGRNWRE